MSSNTKPAADPPSPVHMSVLDRQCEAFVPAKRRQRAFERSLLSNVLFETAAVVPDVYYLISQGLHGHVEAAIREDRPSLMAAAVASGVIISAFRDPDCDSFRTAYDIIRESGIVGLLEPTDCRDICAHLDRAADTGKSSGAFTFIPWPTESVGAMYERRMISFLQPEGDEPPSSSPGMRRMWDESREWRHDVLNEARGRDQSGFRRGSYMAALGESLGLRGVRIDDVSQLFQVPMAPERLKALQALCRWMTDCYAYNQARAFGAMPNFPAYHPDLTPSLLNSLEASTPPSLPETEIFEMTVTAKVPRPSVLLGMDPYKLLAVRDGEAGRAYLDALKEWRGDPRSDTAGEAVRRRFQGYAIALSKQAAKEGRYTESLLTLNLAKLPGPTRRFVKAGLVPAATAVATQVPDHLWYAIAGGASYAGYDWVVDVVRGKTQHVVRSELTIS
ncbi:hypothetical protein GCM10009839_52690 [Catenulispora yoronensis]|uniref:Uncharacterized protein n=1 Tax=Catenulispora yoronensis TaxID=450799 RepID=A0ABP5GD99_9ACTN